MAKKKAQVVILKNCVEYTRVIVKDSVLFCKLKLQDEKILKSSGIVTEQECGYFRKDENENRTGN